MPVESEAPFAHRILRWFDAHARALPWRLPPGEPLPLDDRDWPYRVWLSEIMLQQTTVAAVKPYYAAFLARWPSVVALADAADSDVMAAWAGLGYYARARNLLACARAVRDQHEGRFPAQEAALRALPGLGVYTAAAVAAIAFGQRAVVVDGNVERVVARHHAVDAPLPGAKPQLRALTDALTPDHRAGDFAQAMMDLGATICTPRSPACGICPVAADCAGRLDPTGFPVKAPKKARPERQGLVWWMERNGQVWLVRRPETGMLGGMLALPSDDWDGGARVAGLPEGGEEAGSIRHVFTHFGLTLEIRAVEAAPGCTLPEGGQWWPVRKIAQAGLPSLFAKVAAEMLKGRTP